MPPGPSMQMSRQNIRGSSRNLCIFCQLANSRSTTLRCINVLESRRSTSNLSGSRGLHAGTPVRRPPGEPQSTSSKPAWTAAQPAFDDSVLNAFLKDRRSKASSSQQPVSNLFKANPDELGKWAKSSPLVARPPPGLGASQSREQSLGRNSSGPRWRTERVIGQQRERPSETPALPSQLHPPSSAPTLSPNTSEPSRTNPILQASGSKKSAIDIENDLFAGITSEAVLVTPKPISKTPATTTSIPDIFAKLGSLDAASQSPQTKAPASSGLYTSFNQPFHVSEQSINQVMQSLRSQEKKETTEPSLKPRAVKNFGFWSASREKPQQEKNEMPGPTPPASLHKDLVRQAAEGMKSVESSSWRSASREKWTYEVDVKKEAERAAERLLAEEEAKKEITHEERMEQKKNAEEFDKMIDRGKAARFKLGLKDIALWKHDVQRVEAPTEIIVQKTLYIPPSISVSNFANILKVTLPVLQKKMELLGLEPEQCKYDYVLDDEMASLIAPEFGFEPHIDEVAAFDLFPQPMPEDPSSIPLRPPIVTIMGHVDHGKTTLLDTLRKSSVAVNEAGGITQHIGAFSVSLSSGEKITFLDTPGHAAFLTMRARGANVTDIIVLVVAADDGVMPQTEEAIRHAKSANVPVIVAINKCDLEDADPSYVKTRLLESGVELEEFGGDVQCIEVSGLTGQGLDKLEASILTLAEVLEIRAQKDGLMEGWIIESTVDSGRGTYATVLVKRGTLRTGDYIVAGTTYAKVRRMTTADGKSVKQALPGTPVEIAGWKERPAAGDIVLQARKESDAKLAVRNRTTQREQERDQRNINTLNERRVALKKELWQERERKMVEEENKRSGQSLPGILKKEADDGPKALRVLVKADVSGSAEAVEEAIKDLGNAEVKVEIIDASVGEVTESDITTASAFDAKILGFNIRALNPNLRTLIHNNNIEILYHSIIYKLIDDIRDRLESMLAPMIELTITGEAEIVQLFDITVKGRKTKPIGGCKVFNGVISMSEKCRITRNGKIIFTGRLDTLKHFKDDVDEVRKGSECGLSFAEFEELKIGDLIQSFKEHEVKRKLY